MLKCYKAVLEQGSRRLRVHKEEEEKEQQLSSYRIQTQNGPELQEATQARVFR